MKSKLQILFCIFSLILIESCQGCLRKTIEERAVQHMADQYIADQILEYSKEKKELESIPKFPLPYPKPSAVYVLTKIPFKRYKDFGEVNTLMQSALDKGGYSRYSYFIIPNGHGFAIVTQLEQISRDGSPKPEENRWVYNYTKPQIFSISDYLKSLFRANPGRYRAIVFLISDEVLLSSRNPPSKEDIDNLLDEGSSTLPGETARIKTNNNYGVTVLIYEFRKPENGNEASIVIPSEISGKFHLKQSGILKYLE